MNATPSAVLCTTPPILRVYLRRSLDETKQGASLDTQRAECRRAAERSGWPWSEAHFYTDDDRSGGDSSREEWNRLLREAQPGDLILSYNRDRLSREDPIDAARIVRDLCKRGCRVVYSDGSEETYRSAIDSVMGVLRGFGAAHELERIKARTKSALRQRVRDGFAAGAVAYGYTTVADEKASFTKADGTAAFKKRIIVNEATAPTIVRIFTEYANGRTRSAIARSLNADGIPSPSGASWNGQGVWAVVQRDEYAGILHVGRSRTERTDGKNVRRKGDDPMRIERADLRIVDDDLYQRVRTRIASRPKGSYHHNGKNNAKYALVGIVRCAERP